MLDDDGTPESRFPDSSDYEPDEFDPDSLGPSVPSPEAGDVDPQLQRTFWTLVAVFNVAILALSLGLMLTFLSTYVREGVVVTVAGVVLFALGVWRYRTFQAE